MIHKRFTSCFVAALIVSLLSSSSLYAQYSSKTSISLRNLGGYSSKFSGHTSHSRHRSSSYHRGHHHHHGYHYGGLSVGIGGLYFGYGYPGYNPYYNGYYPRNYFYAPSPYGTYYRPSDNYVEYYLPPNEPAELMYGPQAAKQFLGLDRNFALEPQRNQNLADLPSSLVLPMSETQGPELPPVQQKRPAASSIQAKERAELFVEYGDNLFKQQRVQEALGRYKSAESSAPDLAEAHFRKAFAYLATNRFDHALSSIKRGIFLDSNYVHSGFKLDQLYQSNSLAKSSMLDSLARKALADSQSSDLFYLVGIVLHFDQQQTTAQKYFSRASQLSTTTDQSYITAFKPAVAPATQNVTTQPNSPPQVPVVGYDL